MKQPLDREVVAMRIAKELKDGEVVNVGIGIGDLVGNYLTPDKTIILHSENGVYGFGRFLTEGEEDLMDFYMIDAVGRFLAASPGMSFSDYCDAFDAVHTGRVNTSILGAYQVSERGDLANWTTEPEGYWGSIGGAMDMATVGRVIVGMEHVTKQGEPRIVKQCQYALTARERVNLIVTDLAVIEVTEPGLLLKEIAPGWTVAEVQSRTEPRLIVSQDLKEMEL